MPFRSLFPEPEVRAIGIVFRNGRPVMEDEFVQSLTPEQRAGVARALALHGFKLDGSKLEEIE